MTQATVALADEVQTDMDDESQFVTFQVARELFGFPMKQVLEIIRLPPTVPVPLTPESLVGLANLRGSVLPVLDLRRLLGLETTSFDDLTRVVVVDSGVPVGLVVDRVCRVVPVTLDRVETGDQVQATIDAKLLVGVIKAEDEGSLIQLLDLAALVEQAFPAVLTEDSPIQALENTAGEKIDDEVEEELDQLVSFLVEDQEYAFDLMEIDEIVRVPSTISQVPRVGEHVLGLMDLRGRLLPLVSLRRLFALPKVPMSDDHRIIVVGLRRLGAVKASIGLVVDEVREVLRVSKEVQEPAPPLLGQRGLDDILRVCRLNEGRRLVSVLSTESLFQHPSVQAALVESGEQEGGNMTDDAQQGLEEDDNTAQLVVFQLGEQEYGVNINAVQEITRVPTCLEKVPKTADFIEGMVNLRGTVLPVLDMRTRFGLPKMPSNDRQRIIVLNLNGTRTGFVVDSVMEVLRLPRERIEAAPRLSEDQARLMGQVVNLKEQERMIQLLTVRELLSDQEKTAIQEGEVELENG